VKKLFNKASIDILLVLNLREELSSHDAELLRERLSVNAIESKKAKNLLRAAEYLKDLAQVQIDPKFLPAPLPRNTLVVEKLLHLNGRHLKFLAILAIILSSLMIGFWSHEERQRTTQTLAEVTYAKDLASLSQDLERVMLGADGKLATVNASKNINATDRIQKLEVESLPVQVDITANDTSRISKKVANLRKPSAQENEQAPVTSASFVIRATLKLNPVEQPKQKVLNFLSPFGVQKAGQVELGWQKEKNLFYFHFLTSESFESEIKEGLTKLGELRWVKEPHPRKLADGQSRIILEVKVKDSP